jgi:flagellar biogenesis protein FliO
VSRVPTAFDPNQQDLARRRRFVLLCGFGGAFIVLGMFVPKMLPGSAQPPTESKPQGSTKALSSSEKALPPTTEKATLPIKAAASEKDASAKPAEPIDAPSLSAILTRLLGGTVVVLILCAATAYAVGRWIKGKNAAAPAGPMKVVASLSINTRCAIYLIQVGDQHVVAGVDATGMKTIVHLPGGIEEHDADEKPEIAQAPATSQPETQPVAFSAPRAPVPRPAPERSTRISA